MKIVPVDGVPDILRRAPYKTLTTVIKVDREITISKPILLHNKIAIAFDALCKVSNQDPTELPRGGKNELDRCARDIAEVYTGDDIAGEIMRRAKNYRRNYPGAMLTPSALAKHWAISNNSNSQQSTSSRLLAQAEEEETWQR